MELYIMIDCALAMTVVSIGEKERDVLFKTAKYFRRSVSVRRKKSAEFPQSTCPPVDFPVYRPEAQSFHHAPGFQYTAYVGQTNSNAAINQIFVNNKNDNHQDIRLLTFSNLMTLISISMFENYKLIIFSVSERVALR